MVLEQVSEDFLNHKGIIFYDEMGDSYPRQ